MTFLRNYNCAYILQILLIQLTLVGCVQVCDSDEECLGNNMLCKGNECICDNGQYVNPPVTTEAAVLETTLVPIDERKHGAEEAMYLYRITSTFTLYLFLTVFIGLFWYGLYLAVLNRLRRDPQIAIRQNMNIPKTTLLTSPGKLGE
ncbi:PREDICTED: uncharacterized protein LOC108563271 [Nicrophorus vespilloides]|uniref:Uncharacterized protein LOC108563271 n=1 Tax=Nicrophorus vespilloides TaxID=110193 RepID=A0ABM1MS35_NICVS|nr:PREDICTED: uncharacterized protein LOC108563271 [Nicrophorus vespilloides]